MDDEFDLRDRMAREMADSDPPPLGGLISDAVASAQRLRVRRRFGVVTGGAAAIVAILVAGMLLTPNAGPANDPLDGGSASAPGKPIGPASGPASAPPSGGLPSGPTATTGQAVVMLLESMLPHGAIAEIDFDTSDRSAFGTFLYDDGHGAATVTGNVSDRPTDYGSSVHGMRCPAPAAGHTCEHRVLPDGDQVRIVTVGPEPGSTCPDPKCGLVERVVEVARADGTYVAIDAYNGPFGHDRAPTRTTTVRSTQQLITMVTDPRWGLTMDASYVARANQTIHQ